MSNINDYKQLYCQELLHNVVPFWLTKSQDNEFGGYFTCLDRFGNVYDTDKFMWLQGRQVWLFSMLYNKVEKRQEWLDCAIQGAEFMKKYGHDGQYNWYFSLTREGKPLVEPYNIYSYTFAAMGFGQLSLATGNAEYAEIAKKTFQIILNKQGNHKGKWNKAYPGTRNLKSFSLPMILSNLTLEIEHLLDEETVINMMESCIHEIMNVFLRPDLGGLVVEHVNSDNTLSDTFDGRLINPGHGIEAMWFIMDLAVRLKRPELIDQAVATTLKTIEYGWDKKHGGIFYFMDRKGHPTQQLEWDQKLWWVHIEALISLIKGYKLTGKEDINKSETAFGNQTQMKNRKALWSQYATKMLKAEVYLWSAKVSTGDQTPAASDLATAESALSDIVASSNFQLLSSYNDVFAYNNKGNSEVIFAIRFADGEAGNFVHSFSYQIPIFINSFYDAEGELITSDLLDIKATVVQRHEYKPGLFHLYDDVDERKRDIFLDYYLSDGSFAGTVVKKYNGTLNAQGNRAWSDDLVVYRYADVLLMMAEIQNMKGESVEPYINLVRERAYGESYDAELHGYTDGDFSTNELAILHERDKEFVLEGKRWFDIRRMQQTKDGQPLAFSAAANYDDPDPVISPSSPHLLLWPVDINTLNNDPELVQTEGYE